MQQGRAFALGLAATSAIAFGIELLPMLRDPSLRFAHDRPRELGPGSMVDDLVAMGVFFGALGYSVELLRKGIEWAQTP